MASFCFRAACRSRNGFWEDSSCTRCSRESIWALVRSRMARWAWRSLARFFANCSGVRLATPRADVLFNLRLRPADAVLGASGVAISVYPDGVGESSNFTYSGARGVGSIELIGRGMEAEDSRAGEAATSLRGDMRLAMASLGSLSHENGHPTQQEEEGLRWLGRYRGWH